MNNVQKAIQETINRDFMRLWLSCRDANDQIDLMQKTGLASVSESVLHQAVQSDLLFMTGSTAYGDPVNPPLKI